MSRSRRQFRSRLRRIDQSKARILIPLLCIVSDVAMKVLILPRYFHCILKPDEPIIDQLSYLNFSQDL